jgi:hypothetical protein
VSPLLAGGPDMPALHGAGSSPAPHPRILVWVPPAGQSPAPAADRRRSREGRIEPLAELVQHPAEPRRRLSALSRREADADGVQIVGSAYTNSSFTAFATRLTVTELYAYDIGASPDKLWIQRPGNAGTLITPVSTGLDLGSHVGFDIAGAANVGWLAGTPQGRYASRLYRLDVDTGRTKSLGRIGDGSRTITGLAAVQDQ